jgi:hypothetical protein
MDRLRHGFCSNCSGFQHDFVHRGTNDESGQVMNEEESANIDHDVLSSLRQSTRVAIERRMRLGEYAVIICLKATESGNGNRYAQAYHMLAWKITF